MRLNLDTKIQNKYTKQVYLISMKHIDIEYSDKTIRRKYIDGTKTWYNNGKYHRDNDLPAIISDNGDKYWYKKGERYLL